MQPNHPPRDHTHIIEPFQCVNLLKSRKHTKFKIASWNVRGGLSKPRTCSSVLSDMKKYQVSVIALQETKAKDIIFQDNYGRILGFPTDTPNYGMAFALRNDLQVHSAEYVSDRIVVISIFLNNQRKSDLRPSLLTIINAYAPHSILARNQPHLATTFYHQLNTITHKYRHSTLLYIAGDFNAKIGRKLDDTETFMGSYSKKLGARNSNGNLLANFAASNKMFLSNTAFKHPSRHISTWHGTINGTPYHNQIDYILCRLNNAHILTNARSYRGAITDSDHSIVITTLDFSNYHPYINPLQRQKPASRVALPSTLSSSPPHQLQYQQHLETSILQHPIDPTHSPNLQWETLSKHIHTAIKATLPPAPKRQPSSPLYFLDTEIQRLSVRLREIKLILNVPASTPIPPTDSLLLTSERMELKRRLRHRQYSLHNDRLDNIAQQLDHCAKGQSALQFELSRKLLHNKNQPFKLRDVTTNAPLLTPAAQSDAIRSHYNDFFNQPDYHPVQMFDNSVHQFTPVTEAEVHSALRRLSNGRTKDSEHLHGEFLKYSGASLLTPICTIINQIFLTQTPLDITQHSQLFCLNKPKGLPTVKNLRPITLMSVIRKVMELIILHQIYPSVDAYISPNQSARRKRSTADIIWTYQYQTAFAERYNKIVHILGIDLTKAFDTVDRNLLIAVLTPVIPVSSMAMLRYLMADTSLTVKLGSQPSQPFDTTHGIPQGGALSTLLFAAYMEGPLRTLRANILEAIPINPDATWIDTEYVDDVDIITNDPILLRALDIMLPEFFAPWKLIVNPEKTERFTVSKGTNTSIPKLGSNILPSVDIQTKCVRATIAFRKLYGIWFRPHLVRLTTRIKLYNAFIPPILLYNIGASGLTQGQLHQLDTFHRKQLRILLRVFYPTHISNKQLYQQCQTAPLSIMILENRWKLFGHILRLPLDSPPQLSMTQYYRPLKVSKGQPKTSLPVVLNKELLEHAFIKLTTPEDLTWIRTMADDRKGWQQFTEVIIAGAKVKYDERRKQHANQNAATPPHIPQALLLDQTPPACDYRGARPLNALALPWIPLPVPPVQLQLALLQEIPPVIAPINIQ